MEITSVTELQERMHVTEKELKDRCEELEILRAQLSQTPQVTEEKPSVETEATVQAEIQVQICVI